MRKLISTYKELAAWSKLFTEEKTNVMFLIGNPGLAKTYTLKKETEETARWINGTMSAYGLYCDLLKNKDVPYCIDDVDSLYSDKAAVRLLKQLCNTERTKTINWITARTMNEDSEIPSEFTTSSKVAIIANEWKTLNKNVSAIEDRGIAIQFEPDAKEVHEYVQSFFKDSEILTFIGTNLQLIETPSIRAYIVCKQLKDAGLDWKMALRETWFLREEKIALLELLENQTFKTEEDRIAAWCKLTGLSRPTYHNYKRELGIKPSKKKTK